MMESKTGQNQMQHHGGSRDLDRSVGGRDFLGTSLNSSHSLVLVILVPTPSPTALEREPLLGFSSLSISFVAVDLD